MATNPVVRKPVLHIETENTPTESIVRCSGRFVSETSETLKSAVKPLFAGKKTVVLDLTSVEYMDSSGLGTVVGLYVSAKANGSGLKLINLNKRLKELFSLTRLGEAMAEGRDPNDFGIA